MLGHLPLFVSSIPSFRRFYFFFSFKNKRKVLYFLLSGRWCGHGERVIVNKMQKGNTHFIMISLVAHRMHKHISLVWLFQMQLISMYGNESDEPFVAHTYFDVAVDDEPKIRMMNKKLPRQVIYNVISAFFFLFGGEGLVPFVVFVHSLCE